MLTLATLKEAALARTLFVPTTLEAALDRLGFVQADPIRAPARAQDLLLRHRVAGYRNGDLERRYPELPVAEEVLHNYGYLAVAHRPLVQPRGLQRTLRAEAAAGPELRDAVLRFVRETGEVRPQDVEEAFAHGSMENYWGSKSRVTTGVLDALHYRGYLHVARRQNGIRIYTAAAPLPDPALPLAERLDGALGLLLALYAPLPESSLKALLNLLPYGLPDARERIQDKAALITGWEARGLLSRQRVDGQSWVLPPGPLRPADVADGAFEGVRIMSPFDPVVWDRRRFETFWGWEYRFEAYTPPDQRRYGYYALPLLDRGEAVGWVNLAAAGKRLDVELGLVREPDDRQRLADGLEQELSAFVDFMGLAGIGKVRALR